MGARFEAAGCSGDPVSSAPWLPLPCVAVGFNFAFAFLEA
jgi:hypothetical protein